MAEPEDENIYDIKARLEIKLSTNYKIFKMEIWYRLCKHFIVLTIKN